MIEAKLSQFIAVLKYAIAGGQLSDHFTTSGALLIVTNTNVKQAKNFSI